MTILREGYKFPFTSTPTQYFEDNNLSAKRNMPFLRRKVEEWETAGYYHKVHSQPPVCSPLSVSTKLDLATGETKKRPCLDASRHLNKFMIDLPVKLADLSVSEKMIEPNDWQTALDMQNMYFHVSIAPDHQRYLGF